MYRAVDNLYNPPNLKNRLGVADFYWIDPVAVSIFWNLSHSAHLYVQNKSKA